MAEAVRIAEQHMLFSDLRLTVYQGFRRRRDAGFSLEDATVAPCLFAMVY